MLRNASVLESKIKEPGIRLLELPETRLHCVPFAPWPDAGKLPVSI